VTYSSWSCPNSAITSSDAADRPNVTPMNYRQEMQEDSKQGLGRTAGCGGPLTILWSRATRRPGGRHRSRGPAAHGEDWARLLTLGSSRTLDLRVELLAARGPAIPD
jgi:hypothetical protein